MYVAEDWPAVVLDSVGSIIIYLEKIYEWKIFMLNILSVKQHEGKRLCPEH